MQKAQRVASAVTAEAVTPHDSTDFTTGICSGIYVGGAAAGDVAVVFEGASSAVVFDNVPVGTILPVRARRVNSTGTTATDMVALFDKVTP